MGPCAESLEHANQASTFNAETLTERPAYRNAYVKRCVVPAETFYEWVGPKRKKGNR